MTLGLLPQWMVLKEFLVPGSNWQRHRELSEPKLPSNAFFSPYGGIFGLSVLLLTLAYLPECFRPTFFLLLTDKD